MFPTESVAVAVTGHLRRSLRIADRSFGPACIARAIEHFVELRFQHGLQEFTGSIVKDSFNRIKPIVDKVRRSFRIPTVAAQTSCYGLS